MAEWNEQRLEELVRKMGLERLYGYEQSPIYLSLYESSEYSCPLLAHVMQSDATEWSALGYDETDRVSITRYLGSLGCRTDDAALSAAYHQQPLALELAKALIDAGACDKSALSTAAQFQQPLSLEL